MTVVRSILTFGLLTGCAMPLFHAPPVPVRHSAFVPAPASSAEIIAVDMYRSGCLGACPEYRIALSRNRTAHREGLAFVAIPRCAEGHIPVETFDAVARQLIDSGFFALDSVLDQIMDAPQLVLAADLRDGRRHSVDAAEPPTPLLRTFNTIDSIAAMIAWDSLPTPAKRHPCAWTDATR